MNENEAAANDAPGSAGARAVPGEAGPGGPLSETDAPSQRGAPGAPAEAQAHSVAGDAPTPSGAGVPSEADVMDALSNVIDPELGLDFVELGLIYGVEVSEGAVKVTFTLTTPGCPIGPQVTEQIDEFVGELEGVKTIESEMVFSRRGRRRR